MLDGKMNAGKHASSTVASRAVMLHSDLPVLNSARRRSLLASIALTACLTQSIFLSALPARWAENQSFDYTTIYEPAARSLLGGKGLLGPDGKFLVHYPPGHPLVLAGLFGLAQLTGLSEWITLKAFAAVAGALTSVLVYLIGELFLPWQAAAGAAVIWLSYPFHLWAFKQPNPEVPFTILFLLAILMHARAMERVVPRYALAGGVLVGFTSLIRPIALVFSAVLAFWSVALYRKLGTRCKLTLTGLLLAGNLLTIAPWEILAYQRTGLWIPLATAGPNSMIDGLTFAVAPTASGEAPRVVVSPPVWDLMRKVETERPTLQHASELAVLRFAFQNSDVGTLAELLAVKATRAWYATQSQRLESRILLVQVPYLLFFVIGAGLAWRAGGGPRKMAALAVISALYFWAMSMVAATLLRYLVPVISLLTIPAGYAMFRIAARVHSVASARTRGAA
jgi:hypothetical protein